MKDNSFNNNSLDHHLEELRKINERDFFERKFKSLSSWLEWQKKKKVISQEQYTSSMKKLIDIESDKLKTNNFINSNLTTVNQNSNSFRFLFSYKFITIFTLLFFCLLNIYIYKLYRGLYNELQTKQSSGRVLPFKGVIKQTDGKPLDTKRDVIFNLYNVAKDGSSIYSGKCVGESGLQPDFNGAFTILVGSDCGMKPIPEYIFQENPTLYLGMNIGSESELTPRYQIFTTTYSKDTSKLQGLEPGKNKSSIPYIDESGMIQLEPDSPVIKSTNGVFSIEGNALSLKADDSTKGDILIQPGAESNVVIPFGKLGVGTFKPDSILDIAGTQLFKSTGSIKNLAIPDDENTAALRLSLGTEAGGVKSNFIEFFAGATSENAGTKVGDIRVNNDGVVYETAGADFAEYFNFPQDQEIPKVGTIISLSSKGIHPAVPNEKIIGAVSSTAGFIGNRKDPQVKSVLIALVGQVTVLVSTANGEVGIGDRVGSSSVPGYAGVSKNSFSVGYVLEENADDQFTNEKCPKSYKNKRDPSGKKVRCGQVKIVLDLE